MTKKLGFNRRQFARCMKNARKAGSFSFRTAADMIGVSPSTVYKWEQGRTTPNSVVFYNVVKAFPTWKQEFLKAAGL